MKLKIIKYPYLLVSYNNDHKLFIYVAYICHILHTANYCKNLLHFIT